MVSTQNSERIADQLQSAAVRLLRGLRRANESSGLNGPRLSALSVVVFGGPITLGNLAEAEQVRPPTMTRIVNALVKQGLLAKKSARGDRRTVSISATMKGKRVLVAGRTRRIQALAGRIGTLDPREQATLRDAVAVLRKLAGPQRE